MDVFRNYSRTIADLFPRRDVLSSLRPHKLIEGRYLSNFGGALFLYFGVLVTVLSLFLLLLYLSYKNLSVEKNRVLDEYVYWQDQVEKYPLSSDAYYNAAYYAARVDEKYEALSYIEKSLYLDGEFEMAWKLREEILDL